MPSLVLEAAAFAFQKIVSLQNLNFWNFGMCLCFNHVTWVEHPWGPPEPPPSWNPFGELRLQVEPSVPHRAGGRGRPALEPAGPQGAEVGWRWGGRCFLQVPWNWKNKVDARCRSDDKKDKKNWERFVLAKSEMLNPLEGTLQCCLLATPRQSGNTCAATWDEHMAHERQLRSGLWRGWTCVKLEAGVSVHGKRKTCSLNF